MGRFYQTAKPEFLEDIIYQPPWELIKEALGTQQQDYDLALAKANLLGDVDFKYIEDPVEREKARAKQEYYANRADEITKGLQTGDANNWRSQLGEISKLQKEVTTDYKTGDIYKMQKSAENYAAMEKHLATIKDPVMKERAKEDFMRQWQANPNRSMDQIFTSQDIYDKKDITGDFLKELKQMEPDVYARATASTNGRYIDTKSTSKEVLADVDRIYSEYVKAKGLEPYLQQEQRYGIGNYFDENNQLMSYTDPRSSLYDQAKYAKEFGYTKEKAEAKKDEDQYGLLAAKHAYDKEMEEYKYVVASRYAPKEATPISFSKDVQFVYNHTTQGKEVVREYNRQLANLASQIGAKDPKDYDLYITKIRANPEKYKAQANVLFALDRDFNAKMVSGTEYFRQKGLGQKEVDAIQDKFEADGVDKVLSHKQGYFNFGKVNGKQYGNVGFEKGIKTSIFELRGKTITFPGRGPIKIANAQILPSTVGFTPAMELDDNNQPLSGVTSEVVITPEEGEPFNIEFNIGGDPLNVGF